MKNNSFEEIGNIIRKAEKILLFPHINMDGDTLGSCAALCRALRNLGKECYILIEDHIPANLAFLDRGYCTSDQNIVENQICQSVSTAVMQTDLSDEKRNFSKVRSPSVSTTMGRQSFTVTIITWTARRRLQVN